HSPSEHAFPRALARDNRIARGLMQAIGWRGTSALNHRDVDAADLALGADLHGLFLAAGTDQEIRGKSRGLDEDFDPAAAGGALQVSEHVAAGFAPVAGNPLTLAGHVAGQ